MIMMMPMMIKEMQAKLRKKTRKQNLVRLKSTNLNLSDLIEFECSSVKKEMDGTYIRIFQAHSHD